MVELRGSSSGHRRLPGEASGWASYKGRGNANCKMLSIAQDQAGACNRDTATLGKRTVNSRFLASVTLA